MRIEILDDGSAIVDGAMYKVMARGRSQGRVLRWFELSPTGQQAPVSEPEPEPEPGTLTTDNLVHE